MLTQLSFLIIPLNITRDSNNALRMFFSLYIKVNKLNPIRKKTEVSTSLDKVNSLISKDEFEK